MKEKLKKIILANIIFIIVIGTFWGCSKDKEEDNKNAINIYYTNKNQNTLLKKSYSPKATLTTDLVAELFNKMSTEPDKIDYFSAKPVNVNINKWSLTDNILTIDFDSNYTQMDNVEELLCRSAIVLTLTQLSNIEYVSFTINSQPLTDSKNNPVTMMKSADFVDISGANINSYQEVSLILYYANEKGDKLIPVNYKGLYSRNTSVEKIIIDRLIKGSTDDSLKRTVPNDLKLISVTTKDKVCYVNFDTTFLSDYTNVTPKVELYSIVNSLAELNYINKVQISINGETDKKFRDYVSLQYTFNRNLDIISE